MSAVVSSVNGIQVLVNLRFIEALTLFLLESIKPLKPEKPEEEEEDEEEDKEEKEGTVPRTGVSTSQSVEEKGKESKMSISVKVLHPLIALLEDAGQTSSLALVCQVRLYPTTPRGSILPHPGDLAYPTQGIYPTPPRGSILPHPGDLSYPTQGIYPTPPRGSILPHPGDLSYHTQGI